MDQNNKFDYFDGSEFIILMDQILMGGINRYATMMGAEIREGRLLKTARIGDRGGSWGVRFRRGGLPAELRSVSVSAAKRGAGRKRARNGDRR